MWQILSFLKYYGLIVLAFLLGYFVCALLFVSGRGERDW